MFWRRHCVVVVIGFVSDKVNELADAQLDGEQTHEPDIFWLDEIANSRSGEA